MTHSDPTPRVVVAVMGAVAPICQTVADFWNSLKQGRSGIGPVEGVELNNLKTQIAGQIKDFDHRVRLKHWQRDKTILFSDRISWLAAAAADEAIKHSGLVTPFKRAHRVACIVGSGAGGQVTGETAARNFFRHRCSPPLSIYGDSPPAGPCAFPRGRVSPRSIVSAVVRGLASFALVRARPTIFDLTSPLP